MQIKGKFELKRGEDHLVSRFGELVRVEEERRREEEEEEEKKEEEKKVWNLYGNYDWILRFPLSSLLCEIEVLE